MMCRMRSSFPRPHGAGALDGAASRSLVLQAHQLPRQVQVLAGPRKGRLPEMVSTMYVTTKPVKRAMNQITAGSAGRSPSNTPGPESPTTKANGIAWYVINSGRRQRPAKRYSVQNLVRGPRRIIKRRSCYQDDRGVSRAEADDLAPLGRGAQEYPPRRAAVDSQGSPRCRPAPGSESPRRRAQGSRAGGVLQNQEVPGRFDGLASGSRWRGRCQTRT